MKSNPLSKLFLTLITSAVVFLAASAGADIPAFVLGSVVTNQPLSFTGTRDWQFVRAGGPYDILITQLGVFDDGGDGLVNSHHLAAALARAAVFALALAQNGYDVVGL